MIRYAIPAILLATAAIAQDEWADGTSPDRGAADIFADDTITGESGSEIYGNVCAGCHMPDGQGAVGAGMYPALAGNPNLEYAAYPISIVVGGLRDMPPLGPLMSDEQIVAVVEYLQTGLNDYEADATVEAVQQSRPEDPMQTTGEH